MTVGWSTLLNPNGGPLGLRLFRRPLDVERALPERVPAPLRRTQDVHHDPAHRAGDALLLLAHPGQLLSRSARLRDPPPRAPRLRRHGAGSARPGLLPERARDDVEDEAPL